MPLLRTSLLMSEPAGTLESLDELFALANAMEMEAANRYSELAEDMQRQNKDTWPRSSLNSPPPSASMWIASQDGHNRAAARRLTRRWSAGRLPNLRRRDGRGYRDIAADDSLPRLGQAVRNEERAFAFWSYVAAYSKDSEIKQAAEAMAREELGHVSTLRRERRRAYHKEHGKPDEGGATIRT